MLGKYRTIITLSLVYCLGHLVLALDRDLITQKVTQFGELPSYNLVPPGILDYVSPQPEWAAWTQQQRNAEARRKLEARRELQLLRKHLTEPWDEIGTR